MLVLYTYCSKFCHGFLACSSWNSLPGFPFSFLQQILTISSLSRYKINKAQFLPSKSLQSSREDRDLKRQFQYRRTVDYGKYSLCLSPPSFFRQFFLNATDLKEAIVWVQGWAWNCPRSIKVFLRAFLLELEWE